MCDFKIMAKVRRTGHSVNWLRIKTKTIQIPIIKPTSVMERVCRAAYDLSLLSPSIQSWMEALVVLSHG